MIADNTLELATISESGKAPETRMRSVIAVRQRITEMGDGEDERSNRRALVNGLLDGNPPYTDDELRKLGRIDDANINLRTGEGTVDAAKTPYYDLWAEVPRMLTIKTDYGDDPQKRYEWGEVMSDCLHDLFDEWDGMDNNMQRKQWQMCVHGIGLAMFEDTLDWRWHSRMIGDVLVPDDTEADVDLLDECAVPRSFLPTKLFKLIENAKGNWNVELARKAIINASPLDFRNQHRNNWEAYQDAIRTGDVGWANKSNRIPVTDYLVKEFNGRITHGIVLDDGTVTNEKDDFLFKKIGRFDSFKQVISPFFFDVVGAGLWHGVKGLGPKIFDYCQLENRLTGKNIDQAMLGLIVVPKTADDWETIETVAAAGVTAFRPGTEFITTKLADNLEGPLMVKRDLQGMLQGNIGQYRQRVSSENEEPTLGQAQLNIQQQAMLNKGAVNRYYKSLDRLYREMVRRVFNPKLGKSDPGGKEAHEAREYMMMKGVPREALDVKYICSIKAMRSIGYGSPVIRDIISNKLLALLPTMNEKGRANALRTSIAPLVGQSNVDAFFPSFEEMELPGRQEQQATDENNALRLKGGETKVVYLDNHLIHFDIAFADMAMHLQELQAGQADPIEVLVHLHQGGVHIGAHLNGMRNDPTREEQFKQREAQFMQISKFTDQLQQQVMEAMKAQQEAQPPQMSPELIAAMAKVQADHQVKVAKAQGDMQLKSAKQQATLRLKDLEVASSIRRKNIEAAANAQVSAAETASNIQRANVETAAKLAAMPAEEAA